MRVLGGDASISKIIGGEPLPFLMRYDPVTRLGDDLIADWWAGEGITIGTGGISAWQDRKAGYVVAQSVQNSRPAFNPLAYGGRPAVTPDGSDDYLELIPAPAEFPDGAEACEIWLFYENLTPLSDIAAKTHVMYGSEINFARRVMRVVVTDTVRGRIQTGNGTTTLARTTLSAMTGRNVARVVVSPTHSGISINALTDATPVAVVPATNQMRLRLFATSSGTPTTFSNAHYNRILFTKPLSDAKAALLLEAGMALN